MNINELPVEILLHVFGHLDLRSRSACEKVCQYWRKLMRAVPHPPISLWIPKESRNYFQYPEQRYHCGDLPYSEWGIFTMDKKMATLFLKKHNRGKALFIRAEKEQQLEACLNVVNEEWNHLECLQIECSCSFKSDTCLAMIAQHAVSKYVTRVNIGGLVDARKCVIQELFNAYPNIEFLYLECPRELDVTTLQKLPPRLTTLFLPGFRFEARDLDRFLQGDARQLHEFCIRYCNGIGLRKICTALTDLVTLNVSLRGNNSVECLWPLANLKLLRNLCLEGINKEMGVELLKVLSECSNLKTLAVHEKCVAAAFIQRLHASVPQLEALEIVGAVRGRHNEFLDAMNYLIALSPMEHLRTLSVPVYKGHVTPLVTFIQSSSFIRNIDSGSKMVAVERHKILEAMNEKARANRSEQFQLRICLSREELRTVSANLKVYCY